jgi:transcriptional regulator with XRE-family HTH domain
MEMSFGARLRQHREERCVALSTIATQTKIKITLLEGLERDNISHWPGGIFRRSYLRAYADAIGLDADKVVREFLALYPDPTDEVSAVEAMASALPNRRPPTRLTYLISSAISALPSLRAPQPSARASLSPSQLASSGEEATEASLVVADDFALATDPVAIDQTDPLLSPPLDHQPLLDLGTDSLPFLPRHPDVLMDATFAVHAPAEESMAHDEAAPFVAESLESGANLAFDSLDTDLSTRQPAVLPRRAVREDFGAVAELCTRLGRVCDAHEVLPVLEDATALLDAIGLILWTWDPRTRALRPALSHGYSAELLLQVPPVAPDSDNAIGSAFRSAETRVVYGDESATAALAVPLLTPSGCAGVLAAEFRESVEQHAWVRSVVTILAAQLSLLVGPPAALQAATA